MTAAEILNAYLRENCCAGFVKALLMVHSLAHSPLSTLPSSQIKQYIQKVYIAAIELDQFEQFDAADFNRFEVNASVSVTASIIQRIRETGKLC